MSFNAKKMGSVSVIAAALFAASWGAHAATTGAPAATINFSASVVAQTCTPSWTEKGQDVNFGKVSVKDLAAAGDIGSYQRFTLKLTDCTDVGDVVVTSTGTADTVNAKAFANTAAKSDDSDPDPAKNVAFLLMGGPDLKTPLTPDGDTVTYTLADKADSIEMPFLGELVSTGVATAGPATGNATLYMTYE
ncbi:fimbrial protein [Enterobacter asburiae]